MDMRSGKVRERRRGRRSTATAVSGVEAAVTAVGETGDDGTAGSVVCERVICPWPSKGKDNTVLPVFIPFAGCPGRCVYCAQNLQTAQSARPLETVLDEADTRLRMRRERGLPPCELAFYGGTFTALPERSLSFCLRYVADLLDRGLVSGWRCSTRPDCVGADGKGDVLERLKARGCRCVELGVQSFDDGVLAAVERGYTGATARAACRRVAESGLSLGVQLLPGLPLGTAEGFLADVRTGIGLGADFFRFYPCLVVDSTRLAERLRRGEFTPWDNATALDALADGVLLAHAAGRPVVRIGVAHEDEFEKHVLAGPRDPDLGARVLSLALVRLLEQSLRSAREKWGDVRPLPVRLPGNVRGYFSGVRGENRARLEGMGLSGGSVLWQDGGETVEIVLRRLG